MIKSPKQNRKTSRHYLKQDLSKHIFAGKERTLIKCLGTDVSKEGLGIVCFEPLVPGSEVVLVVNKKDIKLNVAWSKPDPVRDSVFHAGLKTNDSGCNLLDELQAAGLLLIVEPWTFRKLK